MFLDSDDVLLELAGDRSSALRVHSSSFNSSTLRTQLVVIHLVNLFKHFTGFVHLLTIAGHLVDRDLPLALVPALLGVEVGTRRHHLITKEK